MATCKHGHTVGPEVGCVLCDLDAAKARIAELEGENEELRHVLTAALCAPRSPTGERRE